MSIPDALVLLRALAGIPVFALVLADQQVFALALFVAAAITDAFDGFLARRWGSAGPRGALLDPLADKALVVLALAGLAATGLVPPAFAQLVALREGAVTALRVIAYRRHIEVGAGIAAKIKTTLELTAIALLMIGRPPSLVADAGVLLLAMALGIGIGTLPMYFPQAKRKLT
ncbi:MAG TPA: CDP-alcohol phosphatidyltransferase family protein [Candidatus Limnocylindria bacterium]|nr:CDP-alcohol phosphatidyltransferase family protein [Candidatus Limnocylindria bacterium]